jgi:hypothetical protein
MQDSDSESQQHSTVSHCSSQHFTRQCCCRNKQVSRNALASYRELPATAQQPQNLLNLKTGNASAFLFCLKLLAHQWAACIQFTALYSTLPDNFAHASKQNTSRQNMPTSKFGPAATAQQQPQSLLNPNLTMRLDP